MREGSLDETMASGPGAGSAGAGALLGTWRLRSWKSIADAGDVRLPLGEDPEGMLIYTADGAMLTVMARRGRPRLSSDDLLAGSPEERIAAAESFVAYGGRFSYDGRYVIHHVDLSLFPNFVGTDQRRDVEFDVGGDRLTLSAAPMMVRGEIRA
ncbi:MAG: lipocalin-like domain-containing protein [Chloroflexi bacterium]|nr:lipocalin-like domain-containing protein [Chloroflexota bacterium]